MKAQQQHQPLPPHKRQPLTEKVIAGKTLWEWLSLLFIPLLFGLGTIWVTNQQTLLQNDLSKKQHDSDQYIAQQARYDDLLKNYRDGIDTLLLTSGLRNAPLESDVRAIAHSRTLDILRQIDTGRKGAVIAYLADLGLVQGGYYDTTGNWHKRKPIISLYGADLYEADLTGADLNKADLNKADLTGADLSGARNTTPKQLAQATSLSGTIMPDGTRHP